MVVYLGKATPASGSGGGSGDAVWGSITGTLSDQTDLAAALAEKQDTLTAGSGIDITNDVISATISGLTNTATGTESLTVLGTATSALYSINIGSRSSVTNYNSVVMGNSASASGTDATAIGCLATASDNYATAIGKSAQATNNASIALGPSAVASGVQCYQIGNGTNSNYKTLNVGFGPLHGNYILLDGTTGLIPTDRLTVMTGADGSNAGTKGAVPAPAATDNTKFLRGDGTWATAGGGSDGFSNKFGSNIYHFYDTPNSDGLIAAFLENSSEQNCSNVTTLPGYWCAAVYANNAVLTSLSFPDLTNIGAYGLNQVCQGCTSLATISFPDLTNIGAYGMQHAFDGCTSITSVSFPSLEKIGFTGMEAAFYNCTGITSASFPSLTTMSNMGGCLCGCTSLTSVDLSAATSAENNVYTSKFTTDGIFTGCTSLTTVRLPALTKVGSNGLVRAFNKCSALTDVYFDALTSNSFVVSNAMDNMMKDTGTGVTHTLHFPSNLETTIQGLTGYPAFGGDSGSVSLVYDLPATS